jgi:hypothetical protein
MAISKDCPIWKTEKQIQQTKVTKNITFAEARKIVEPNNLTRPTYAKALITTKTTKNTECQTTLTWVKTNKPERFIEKPPPKRPSTISLGCQTEPTPETTVNKQNIQTKSNSLKVSEKQKSTTPKSNSLKVSEVEQQHPTTSNSKVKAKDPDKSTNIQTNRIKKGDKNPLNLYNKYMTLEDEASDDMEVYYNELNQAQRPARGKSRSSRSISPGAKRK